MNVLYGFIQFFGWLLIIVLFNIMTIVHAQGSKLLIEASLSKKNPYVQESVQYTLHLWRDSHLQHGYFLRPDIPNAILLDGEESIVKEVTKDGLTYELLERNYILIPQESGELILPQPVFSSRDIFITGQPLSIHVKPQPEIFSEQTWLIAKSVHFEQSWIVPEKSLQIGVPIERTIILKGTGLMGSQLPNVHLLSAGSFQAEGSLQVDDSVTVQKFFDNSTHSIKNGEIYGQRIMKLRYIANQSGHLSMPDIHVIWWNSLTGAINKERIPGQSLLVEQSTSKLNEKTLIKQENKTKESSNKIEIPLDSKHSLLKKIFLKKNEWVQEHLSIIFVFIILLFVFLLMKFNWLNHAFITGKTIHWNLFQKKYQVYKLHRSLVQACEQDDCYRVKCILLEWAEIQYPEQIVSNLIALSDKTKNIDEKEALTDIDRCLFGNPKKIQVNKNTQSYLISFMQTENSVIFFKSKSVQLPQMWQDGSE